jgi:hypothetical protein
MQDLPIIQKTYDLIKWYVPVLNCLPKNHKFNLGDRMIAGLYDLLEGLILARYAHEKLAQLELLNAKLDILRHQTRLLFDFSQLKNTKNYEGCYDIKPKTKDCTIVRCAMTYPPKGTLKNNVKIIAAITEINYPSGTPRANGLKA